MEAENIENTILLNQILFVILIYQKRSVPINISFFWDPFLHFREKVTSVFEEPEKTAYINTFTVKIRKTIKFMKNILGPKYVP